MNSAELICKVECQELIARYFNILDSGPRTDAVELFTQDGRMFVTDDKEGAPPADMFAALPPQFVPVHLATNVVITPAGPDAAEGIAYAVAYNIFGGADDALPRRMPPTPSRIGRVQFSFKRTPAGWRISAFRPLTAYIDDGLT